MSRGSRSVFRPPALGGRVFHLDDALAHLGSAVPPLPAIPNVPMHELTRSRAAAETGRLAARAELFLAHYEHRVRMPMPEHWCERPDEVPQWMDGVLPEPKYAAFRHDLPVGTFHPGQRAKWTAHELCHRLVGFAWRREAPPLFTATASRLAELLPVVLWYFLDEVGLSRCEAHTGPLFRTFCPDCEQAALRGPLPLRPEQAEPLLRDAQRFVQAELDAIARTRQLGRPAPHVWGSLDLCSDGVAYARGHHARLSSPAFLAFADRFLQAPEPMWCSSIEELEQRVLDTLRALACGAPLEVRGEAARWARWDLAQRVLEVWEQCEGEAADELLSQVDALAGSAPLPAVLERYRALHDEYDVPAPEDVFGVGYDLDEVPSRSVAQVARGLETVTPLVQMLAHDANLDLVAPFVAQDPADRAPLGVRFSRWLQQAQPGPLAELGRYEAALRAAGGDGSAALGTAGQGWRLAPGAEAHAFSLDVVRLAELVDNGEIAGRAQAGRVEVEATALAELARPMGLVIGRDLVGELVIAELEPDQVPSVLSAPEQLPEEVREELVSLGLVVRSRWDL
jgi:hypothetical protein